MIEMIDIDIKNAVAYRAVGKITEDEMQSILSVFRQIINSGEKPLVYQKIVSIGGAEVDAIHEFYCKTDAEILCNGQINSVAYLHK